MRSQKSSLSRDPQSDRHALLKLFFWIVIFALYALGGIALFLRTQFGPVIHPTPTSVPSTPEPTVAITQIIPTATHTPYPTLTPTATLYPTATPKP